MLKSEEDNQSAEDSSKKKKIPDVFQPRRPWVQQTCIYLGDCCFIPSLLPQLFILHVGFNEECNKGMIRINSG